MRTLILCCVVAVLALGSWLLWMSPDAMPTAPSKVPVVAGAANVPPPVADAPEAPPPEVVAREAVTTREATDNEAPPLPDDATWLELTVVDAITQQPAPGVDVWWTNETQHELVKAMPRRERDALFSDRDVLTTRFGWHALTDNNGKIRVTPGENGASVMARDATRFVVTGDRFEVRGEAPEGRYRLAVRTYLHLPVAPIEFQPGQQDLRIEVHCGNQPEITCLLPDKVPPGALRVMMVQPDVQKAPTDPFDIASRLLDPSLGEYAGRAAGDSGAHRFTWRALPDGRYTLRIFGAPQAPLLEIPDVVLPLPDGGDARLVDIDLRQLVTPLHLTVKIDETLTERIGRGVMVFALPQPADADWYGIKALNGECVLAAPHGPMDLLVKEDASMPSTLSGVQDEAEVTIRPWPSVEVTFTGIDALPEGAQLSANARMEDPAVRNRDRRRYHADGSSGMVENLYSANRDSGRVEDGKITLQLIDNVTPLHVSLRFGRRSKQLTQFSPSQLVAGQPVTVQLSAEELQQAVAELQAQGGGK
ncbi:MAG: hypothetical protein H6835_17745 [Planctomycetes bacterium]|nr:hypothetical protein [Planctomycetota bacterium]